MVFDSEPFSEENGPRTKNDGIENPRNIPNSKDVSESMDFEEMESVMWRKV